MLWVHLIIGVLWTTVVKAQLNPYADCCENYCYRDDENPYLFLGTKTAYEFVYGKSSNQHIVPYCRPVQFWSFVRFGARYPRADKIRELENLQKLKENIIKNYDTRGSYPDTGRLCDKDLEAFRRWQWNTSISEGLAEELTQQGKDDLKFLARRYQTRYHDLLRDRYSVEDYEFRYSEVERTRSSYEAYSEGLFANDAYRSQAQPVVNDGAQRTNLRQCPSWERNVENNPNTLTELRKFKGRDEYKRVIAHASRRLGFRYTLNESLIENMYDMCRYEKAWYVNRVSPWCAAFTKDNLKILEYAQDLEHYYKTGYGTQMNAKLGCGTVKDIMGRFERIINGVRHEKRAVIQFGDTKTMNLLLVALGINKDSLPLTADNMQLNQRRKWRTSTFNPFSANLVAVLYDCNEAEKNRIMFFLNEIPVDYPGCAVGLCSWNFIRAQLHETINQCDLEFCDRASANNHYNIILTYSLLALSLLITFFKI